MVPALRLLSSPPPSDGELCRAFLAGDAHAFGELVKRHQDTVYRLVSRYARGPAEAADLSQRAFLQAFEAARRALPKLLRSPEVVPFRAWLLRIAVNLGKNARRDGARWRSSVPSENDVRLQVAPRAHEGLERAEAEVLMRRAVKFLPRRQREVFSLRVDGELPFAEVAATLGISEVNAKTHFHYAVKRLRLEVQRLSLPPRASGEDAP